MLAHELIALIAEIFESLRCPRYGCHCPAPSLDCSELITLERAATPKQSPAELRCGGATTLRRS